MPGEPVSFLRQPAQTVTRQETGESEVKRVRQQAVLAIVASEVAWLAFLGIIAILGQSLMCVVVSLGIVAAGAYLFAWYTEWRWRVGVFIVATTALGLLWLYAPVIAVWAWSLRVVASVWGIGSLLLVIWNAYLLTWRMSVEVVNPSWPAPLQPRDAGNGGVGWPWTRYRDPNAPLVRDVPDRDPVLVYAQNGEPRQVQREEIRELMTSAGIGQAEAAVTPRERELHDLRTFIIKGSRPGVGFSRRAWEGRPLPYLGPVTQAWWADTTDKLVHAGVLERVGNRTQLACAVDVALEAVR